MKKIFMSVVLVAGMLLSIYSCSAETKSAGENNNAPENPGENMTEPETEPVIPDNLPEFDFGGYNFKIYLREHVSYNEDFHAESENGDIINDTVYKRNKTVEDRFNINIAPVFYNTDDWPMNDAKKVIKSGDDAYDLMGCHGGGAFAWARENLTIDWFENMPYIDFGAPWWSGDIIKNFAAGGKLYCAAGDLSHNGLASTICLLFNKNLFQDLNIDYPYQDVINGAWTLDKFISIVKSGPADLNGDGAMTPQEDRFGFHIYNEWNYPISVLYCGGDRIISIDGDGRLSLTPYNDRTVSIFEKFFDMINSGAAYVGGIKAGEDSADLNIFRDGRALFYSAVMKDIIEYRAMEDDIGIIPLPKYDEATPKYYANIDAGQNVFAVPVTASELDRTSVIVEALCAEGHRTVMPVFYETALKTKFARDDESAEMLDYIKNSRVYDYGYFDSATAGDLAYIGRHLVTSRNPNFTSFYERNEARVQKNIDKLNGD